MLIAFFVVFLIIISCCLFILYMYRTAKNIHIRQEEVSLPEWPEGFDGVTFLFVTDLHRERFSQEIKDKIQSQHIDLVLVGGDIAEKGVPLAQIKDNMNFLCTLAPTYFVWGNHDYEVDNRALDVLLQQEGVHILDNRATAFESGSDRLWLIGVDDVSRHRDELSFALQDIDSPGYRMLLAHDPKIVSDIKKEDNIRMVWSGHTHGGQILLPFLSKKLYGAFYSKYSAGFYEFKEKGVSLFISQGVGTSHLPLRLGTKSELYLFTIRSRKPSQSTA